MVFPVNWTLSLPSSPPNAKKYWCARFSSGDDTYHDHEQQKAALASARLSTIWGGSGWICRISAAHNQFIYYPPSLHPTYLEWREAQWGVWWSILVWRGKKQNNFLDALGGYGYPQVILFCDTSGLMRIRTRCNTGSCPIENVIRDKAHCIVNSTPSEQKTQSWRQELSWSASHGQAVLVCLLAHSTIALSSEMDPSLEYIGVTSDILMYLEKSIICITVILSILSLHSVLQPVSLPFSVHHISELGRSRQMNLLWMMRKENDRAQKNLFLWILCHEKW